MWCPAAAAKPPPPPSARSSLLASGKNERCTGFWHSKSGIVRKHVSFSASQIYHATRWASVGLGAGSGERNLHSPQRPHATPRHYRSVPR